MSDINNAPSFLGDEDFLNPHDEIQIYQRRLPHWQQPNVFYFITYRLADSIPKEKAEQLLREREQWLALNVPDKEKPLSKIQVIEYNKLFTQRVEEWLNNGYGSCVLKDDRILRIVSDTLRFFDNKRYMLDEWVIMPNHVHVLVKPLNEFPVTKILHSWKSFSANEINKVLGKSGMLWMPESYDHIVRNLEALDAIRRYIRNNPKKAGLELPESARSWK